MSLGKGIFRIIRPLNGVVATVSLLPGLTLASGRISFDWLIGAVLFLLVSFGYAINDIYDLIGDRENDRQRPLVSGQLSIRAAWILSALLALLVVVLSLFHSQELLAYSLVLLVALYGYAVRISTILGVANLWVALMCASVFALPLWLHDFAAAEPRCLLLGYAILLSFLYHLGREIVKDIEDVRGDLLLKRATLPLVIGAERSRALAFIVFLSLSAVSYLLYSRIPHSLYLWIVTAGVNLPIVLIFLIYLQKDPVGWAGRMSLALKLLMLPALASLLVLGLD